MKQALNSHASGSNLDISGWLVIIDGDLYLLEENLHTDYKQSMKIRLTDPSIMYVVRRSVLPLGGGESFVFHKARIVGDLNKSSIPEVVVKELYIQEKGEPNMIQLDVSQDSINSAKKQYESAFDFDFFKEMGDH